VGACWVVGGPGGHDVDPVCVLNGRIEERANALLIAASPDLLAACVAIEKAAQFIWGKDLKKVPAQWREELTAIRAAITKARGA
jgi:hypothetical protein